MSGKIIRYDCYDLRKFKIGQINNFIDIGANKGTTSLMAKILMPDARIIAFEPCKETYSNYLVNNVSMWGIECHNTALGDGTSLCFVPGRHSGVHRFCVDNIKEKKWWPPNYKYTIESKTINNLFKNHNISINSSYILKIDCEGGERFLLQKEQKKDSLNIIRNSVQTMIEIHFGFGGNTEQWNSYFNEIKNTHDIKIGVWKDKKTPDRRYEYVPCNSLPNKGFKQFELINKKWFQKNM